MRKNLQVFIDEMNREMEEDSIELAEEYYNCGYDGIYESKEKAIIFKCVGRGLKIPPLSQTCFPSFILEKHSTQNVRPSHHVVGLMAPAVTAEESNPSKKPADKPQSSQDNQCSDIHSESSDLDVYMSDEDDDVDECDSYPARTDYPVQNTIGTMFLPPNMICKAECSAAGNRLVLSETDVAKSERDDSFTSDDEIFSNPSLCDDSGSDNENISAPTNNLNQTISCTVSKNSANDSNSTGGEKNIYLEEDLSLANTVSLGVSDTSQASSTTEHQPSVSSDDSNPSEAICTEKTKNSPVDQHESSLNVSMDPVADLFSSGESLNSYFVNHFETFNRVKEVNFATASSSEFPELSAKRTQKPQKMMMKKVEEPKVEILPSNELNIKSIAALLLTKPADTNEKSVNVEISKKDPAKQSCQRLVIENLPRDFRVDSVENMLLPYGIIENTTMIPFCDKTTAKVEIVGDLEWIIECIDGSEAFGAGEEPLRCYIE